MLTLIQTKLVEEKSQKQQAKIAYERLPAQLR